METPDERALATEVAERSVTLLTNDGTLPVDPASVGRVAVLGPNADQVMALFGNYSFENHLVSIHYSEAADAVQVPTVLDALRERFASSVVEHRPGCGVMDDDRSGIAAAAELAAEADVAFVVVGDKAGHFKQGTVGEGTDRSELSVPGVQGDLVDAVIDTGTPTVVVLLNGRPFTLAGMAARAAAIVEAWFPGQDGAAVVADVLTGRAKPIRQAHGFVSLGRRRRAHLLQLQAARPGLSGAGRVRLRLPVRSRPVVHHLRVLEPRGGRVRGAGRRRGRGVVHRRQHGRSVPVTRSCSCTSEIAWPASPDRPRAEGVRTRRARTG